MASGLLQHLWGQSGNVRHDVRAGEAILAQVTGQGQAERFLLPGLCWQHAQETGGPEGGMAVSATAFALARTLAIPECSGCMGCGCFDGQALILSTGECRVVVRADHRSAPPVRRTCSRRQGPYSR